MIIVFSAYNLQWVSGVFTSGEDADEYMDRCLRQRDVSCRVVEAQVRFPFFIVERGGQVGEDGMHSDHEYEFVNEGDLAAVKGPATVYRVGGPWQPPLDQAGLYYLPGLDHWTI
jgi:hypothetical protein